MQHSLEFRNWLFQTVDSAALMLLVLMENACSPVGLLGVFMPHMSDYPLPRNIYILSTYDKMQTSQVYSFMNFHFHSFFSLFKNYTYRGIIGS